MRAMAVTSYDAPLEPIEVPEPGLLPGHAMVEILTSGVCSSDLKTSRGMMPFSADLALPHIPGHEIHGRVVATDPPGSIAEGTRAVVHHYWSCGALFRVPPRRRDALPATDRLDRVHPSGGLHRADRRSPRKARRDPGVDRPDPRGVDVVRARHGLSVRRHARRGRRRDDGGDRRPRRGRHPRGAGRPRGRREDVLLRRPRADDRGRAGPRPGRGARRRRGRDPGAPRRDRRRRGGRRRRHRWPRRHARARSATGPARRPRRRRGLRARFLAHRPDDATRARRGGLRRVPLRAPR